MPQLTGHLAQAEEAKEQAPSHCPDKPHLLLCFAGVMDSVQSLLDRHLVVHPLCLPLHLHPQRTGRQPDLPVADGEGVRERDGLQYGPATTAQAIEYVKRHPVDAIMLVVATPCTRQLIEAASPRLKHIACASIGYNHIDLQAAAEYGVTVSNAPGVLTETTADLVVALLLATARRVPEAVNAVKNGEWTVWHYPWMCGKDVHGSTVGLVGFGNIAQAVARRLRGFDCHILYSGPREKRAEAAALGAEYVTFDELLARSDFVVPQCPLLPSTHRMFGLQQFERMKRDAIFVNAARGPIVDQDALITALQTGLIAAAGLDVTDPEPLPVDSPLLKLSNCLVTPHVGVSTSGCIEAMFMTAALNVTHAFSGQMERVHVVPSHK